jgi:hypothetical protein
MGQKIMLARKLQTKPYTYVLSTYQLVFFERQANLLLYYDLSNELLFSKTY